MCEKISRIDLSGVNCYLIEGRKGFILVDTGGHLIMDKQFTNRCDLLQNQLDTLGCTEHNLNLIILTHGDNDHACNAVHLREKYKSKIAMHEDDLKLVQNPDLQEWMNSFHYHSFVYKLVFGLLKKTITKVTQKTINDFKKFTPDIFLHDGFDLSPYGADASIIHLPGHTLGSIAVLTNNGDLIAGDTFTYNKKASYAPNAIDFKQLHASIKKLKNYSIQTVYPGHGNAFNFNEL